MQFVWVLHEKLIFTIYPSKQVLPRKALSLALKAFWKPFNTLCQCKPSVLKRKLSHQQPPLLTPP
jgi:hypothetical protein